MFKKIVLLLSMFVCMAMIFNISGFAKPGRGNSENAGNPFADITKDDKVNSGITSKLDIFNVKGIKSGLIKVNKNIFYPTDTLNVSVVLPKSLKAIWNGDADVYLVIRMADGSMLPPFQAFIAGETPDKPRTFVELDLSENPLLPGNYQLALIMVNPGGDALNLSDWYGGFSGLISATTFKIATQCDPADSDCDGIVEVSGLIVTPSSITLELNGYTELNVYDGTPPYEIESGDTGIATVSVDFLNSDGALTVTGVAAGTVDVTITDNEGESVTVPVTVTDTSSIAILTAGATTTSFITGETKSVTISGGSGGYEADSNDRDVATASMITTTNGDEVEISGVNVGTAIITIKDSDGNSVAIDVTVTNS